MTTTTSSPPTSLPDGNASTAPSTPRKRYIRCMRCSGRKFHTSKDLALHILSKHSRAHMSDSVKDSLQEDARSITVSSPQIISAQIAELDSLLAAHEKETSQNRVKSHEKVSQSTTKLIKRKRNSTVTPREQRKTNLGRQKQKRQQSNHVYVQADSNKDTDSVSDSYSQPIFFDSRKENRNEHNERMRKTRKLSKNMSPVDGESIGPTSVDLLVRNCRERRVPLVPELKPTQVLNFANALF